MGKATPARVTALRVLGDCRRRRGRAREVLRGAKAMKTLDPRDRALVTRLVMGVTVARGELDRRIDAFASRPRAIQPQVRDALRLAAFETLYLDTPTHVAVSQGVELVRMVSARAAGLANAVLRRVAGLRGEVHAARSRLVAAKGSGVCFGSDSARCGVDDLVAVSGYPHWLVSRLCEVLGGRSVGLCLGSLDAPPVYVAAGPSTDGAEVLRSLEADGLAPRPIGGLGPAWELEAPAGLASSGLVDDATVVVADLAAQLVCRIACVPEGRMLEVGQGRGTKSLLLESVSSPIAEGPDEARPLHVSACELSASKVRASRARMEKAGLADLVTCVEFDGTMLGDETSLPDALAGEFDCALVDAPCSGTGTMRRHPEIPWSLAAESLDPSRSGSLPALQLRLLSAASRRVRVGGSLAYATCSVLPEENMDVVSAFLGSDAGGEWELADILDAPCVRALDEDGRALVASCRTDEGAFQSVTGSVPFDGHFCALLRRRS